MGFHDVSLGLISAAGREGEMAYKGAAAAGGTAATEGTAVGRVTGGDD